MKPQMPTVKVGILGCGNISAIYLKNCKQFDDLEVVAVSDLNSERARMRAEEFGVPRICSPEELLVDSDIEVILNLTLPAVHYKTSRQILEAGKHVYVEKPLAVTLADGQSLQSLSQKHGPRIGAAPDTFLGAGLQTCRKVIDDGWIGRPIAATANMLCHGHEHWHPDPAFYYQQGGGPLLDMGPYYLTALIALMGPIYKVQGSISKSFETRLISSAPKFGEVCSVETPTHLTALLDFTNGAICTMTMSFDVWSHNQPCLEIYGTEGSMGLPDPNTFGGPIKIKRGREKEWSEMPLTHPFAENSRGLGLADMMYCIHNNQPHRANSDLAQHVLEVMCAVETASVSGSAVSIDSKCEQPAQMPMNVKPNSVEPA